MGGHYGTKRADIMVWWDTMKQTYTQSQGVHVGQYDHMSYVLICAVQVVLFKAKQTKCANIWLKYAFCMSKALTTPYSI